jgi:hypothetical protein
MKLLHRRVSAGDTIQFGTVHEKSAEKNGSNVDIRLIHSGEESEYVVIRENVDRDDPEFEPPNGSHFLGLTRNSNMVNRSHIFFAVPLEQYGGGSE